MTFPVISLHTSWEPRLQQEITTYIVAIKHDQSDLAAYPLRQLWAQTWPVWLQSWQGIGIVGFATELWSSAHHDTPRTLRQQEEERQRRALRFQHRARRRTRQPTHIPDAVGGKMVVGVPIRDDEEV